MAGPDIIGHFLNPKTSLGFREKKKLKKSWTVPLYGSGDAPTELGQTPVRLVVGTGEVSGREFAPTAHSMTAVAEIADGKTISRDYP